MPTAFMKNLAARHKLSLSKVEGFWSDCKAAIKPGKDDDQVWGQVVNCVKAKCRQASKK